MREFIDGNAKVAEPIYREARQAVQWYEVHGGSYGRQTAAHHLRKLADKLDRKANKLEYKEDAMDKPRDIPTDQGDEIIVQDEDSDTTYVFRGHRTYILVGGKEVPVENKSDEQKRKIPVDRSGE